MIEKHLADSMLQAFRNMTESCKQQGHDSADARALYGIMAEMEQLALDMDDFGSFSATLTTGGYFNNFSNTYGKVIAAAAASSGHAYNDAALLKQTLSQYADALQKAGNHPDKQNLRQALQEILALGRSGISYPTFLRQLIEKGLDKALEGSTMNRQQLEDSLQLAMKMQVPYQLRKAKALLDAYDILVAASPWQVADPVKFAMEQWRIEEAAKGDENRYNHISFLIWQRIIRLLHDWVDAHTSFAPADTRYQGADTAATAYYIRFHKACNPGLLQVYEDILLRNHGLSFSDIFNHEAFLAEQQSGRTGYQDAYIDFLKTVYPQCKPAVHASAALVAEAERLHNGKLVMR